METTGIIGIVGIILGWGLGFKIWGFRVPGCGIYGLGFIA